MEWGDMVKIQSNFCGTSIINVIDKEKLLALTLHDPSIILEWQIRHFSLLFAIPYS